MERTKDLIKLEYVIEVAADRTVATGRVIQIEIARDDHIARHSRICVAQ